MPIERGPVAQRPDPGSPAPYPTASGSPYDVGRQLGARGARAVHGYLLGTAAWRNVMACSADGRVTAVAALVEDRFPSYALELRGLADGLALSYADVFAWNCRGDLWAMVPDGCTMV